MENLVIVIEDELSIKHDLGAQYAKFTAAYCRQIARTLSDETRFVLLSNKKFAGCGNLTYEPKLGDSDLVSAIRVAYKYAARKVAILPISRAVRTPHALVQCLELLDTQRLPVISCEMLPRYQLIEGGKVCKKSRETILVFDGAVMACKAGDIPLLYDAESPKWLYQWGGCPVLNFDFCSHMYGENFVAAIYDAVMGNKVKTSFL